jgi:hypothetical protein
MATSPLNARACARQKTAIAAESGNIQGMAEKYIMTTNDYAKQRIGVATFDPSEGEDPVKVRYSTTIPDDAPYVDLLINGKEEGSMTVPGCDGEPDALTAMIDKRGAFGCNIPGSTIYNGYDEFYRTLKGKAWETDPVCVMDLMLKKHTPSYIRMLRGDLPKRAMEQFNRSLVRNVIAGAKYNTAVTGALTFAQGVFPNVPTGVLDIGYLKRVRTILNAEGWNDMPFEVQVSRESLSAAIQNYKADYNLQINTTPVANDKIGLEGLDVVEFEGIRFILTDLPTRGYLLPTPAGFELHIVNPTKHRAGTGGGVVPEVDNDYYNCFHTCNGQTYPLYEVGLFIHPKAATRESFAPPQMANKSFSRNLFNFEVKMIDGAYIENNVDNFKFYFRLLHAYAFESLNPELMGAIIYQVQPDLINVHAAVCSPEGTAISIPVAEPSGPQTDPGVEDECVACGDEVVSNIEPLPTEDDTCPEVSTGILALVSCGPVITDKDVGTMLVGVERIGGSDGAASVEFDTSDPGGGGSATAGVDYTAIVAEVVNWADGENGVKYVEITIDPTGAGGGLIFVTTLSTAVGGTLANGTDGCATADVQID